MKGLTEKQKNMLEFMEDFMNTTGMAPTIYEIAEHFQIKTSTVFAHIRALQKKGVLTRSSKARSIRLNKPRKKNRMPAGTQAIPILSASGMSNRDVICDAKVFRRIAAGAKNLFAMHVSGTDLKDQGILDGDIVIVKSHPVNVASGDIVLTELNGRDVFRTCRAVPGGRLEMGREENGCFTIEPGKPGDHPVKGVVIGLQRSI